MSKLQADVVILALAADRITTIIKGWKRNQYSAERAMQLLDTEVNGATLPREPDDLGDTPDFGEPAKRSTYVPPVERKMPVFTENPDSPYNPWANTPRTRTGDAEQAGF